MAAIREMQLKKNYKTLKVTRFGNITNFFLNKKQLDYNRFLKSNIISTNQ